MVVGGWWWDIVVRTVGDGCWPVGGQWRWWMRWEEVVCGMDRDVVVVGGCLMHDSMARLGKYQVSGAGGVCVCVWGGFVVLLTGPIS